MSHFDDSQRGNECGIELDIIKEKNHVIIDAETTPANLEFRYHMVGTAGIRSRQAAQLRTYQGPIIHAKMSVLCVCEAPIGAVPGKQVKNGGPAFHHDG